MTDPVPEKGYLPRHLSGALEAALADTPVVCLLGPRQCGKSTLSRHCERGRHYVSLDDKAYLDLALADPQGFIGNLPEQVAIDEVQRAPELTLAIKRSVDANRKPGRFLLTGSANLLQLPRLADSLAGRMECLSLHPLTVSEIRRSPGRFLTEFMAGNLKPEITESGTPRPSELPSLLVAGGYPESITRDLERADRWRRNYLRSVVERDIRDIAEVKDASDLTRLLAFLETRSAQLLNQSAISQALGHSRATIDRYLTLLERLFLIRLLPAWHSNRSKRLVKTPKIHFVDSGLAATLGELEPASWNAERSRFGHLLESFVLQQLIAMADCMLHPPLFYHYRDRDKIEVDIVIESRQKIWGVEIKAGASANRDDAKGLLKLAGIAGKSFQAGIVFYDGEATFPLHQEADIHAVALSKLWEL
ncbi:MAG: AAA family ATPase [Verrucomicrobiia bacterium Tous-C4TDCM]|nr:MAG: AAA family ATPase [Verrucomicrobiae bacterium Tous-C4TDCM]